MQTRVTGLLKTEYPIIQGWRRVADYHLAAPGTNGGGLGRSVQRMHRQNGCRADQRGQKTDGQTLWCQYHADEPSRR